MLILFHLRTSMKDSAFMNVMKDSLFMNVIKDLVNERNEIFTVHEHIVQLFSWQNLVDEKLIWGSDDRGGANQNKVLIFGERKSNKRSVWLFSRKYCFKTLAEVRTFSLLAPPTPWQFFFSVPLPVKQHGQMSSQLVSKGSASQAESVSNS